MTLFLVLFISFLYSPYCLDNGLAIKPPLGWRSYNAYGAGPSGINQTKMMQNIEALLDKSRNVNGKPTSLAEVGYVNIGVDQGWVNCTKTENKTIDYWHNDTAPNGWPIVHPEKFPNITAMIDYVHANGLKMGWYMNCCGCKESNAYPANEKNDVLWLREHDIDGIKLDGCGSSKNISNWQRFINETSSKPILTENCHDQPNYANLSWCPMNFFRTSSDISNSYVHVISNNFHSLVPFTQQYPTGFISRPGCWAYPDMLEVGNFHPQFNAAVKDMTQSHFSAWCIASAPLILGFKMNNATKMDLVWDIITNNETLAVSQSWAGHPGRQIKISNYNNTLVNYEENVDKVVIDSYGYEIPSVSALLPQYEIWAKPQPNNKWAVLLMNNDGNYSHDITLEFSDIPWKNPTANIRDIVNHKDLGTFTSKYTAKNVAPFASSFLILSE